MKSRLELLKEARDLHRQEAHQGKSKLELLKEAKFLQSQTQLPLEIKDASTIGEDISSLGHNIWEGAKNLPGAAVKTVQGIAKHPGQAAAGLIPGITSLADIPGMVINAGIAIPEYVGEKITGKEMPENMKHRIPHYGEEFGTKIANKLAGEPQTESEHFARTGGELGSSLINPSQIIKKGGTGIAKLPGKAVLFSPEKYETFQKAGINPKLSEVSNTPLFNKIEKGLEHIPFSAGKLRKFASERENKLNNMFESLGNIHETKPIRKTGELTAGGGKEYNIKAKEITGKLFNKAFEQFDKTAPVKMESTYKGIRNYFDAISPEARLELAESPTGKKLLKFEERIINSGGAIPFDDLRKVYKKDLDKGVKMWGTVADLDQGELKKISGAIKKDMDSFVEQNYPESKKALEKANKHYKLYSDRNKEIANTAITETDPIKTFNGMMSDFKGGDIDAPKVLLQRMKPNDKKTFSEIFNAEIGRGDNGAFDINKWAHETNRMRPESLDLALSGYPKTQGQQLKDIAKAIPLMEGGKSVEIPSGLAFLVGALSKIDPVTGGSTLGTSWLATELFVNPKVTKAMYEASKAKTPLQLKHVIAKYPTILPRIEMAVENAPEFPKADEEEHVHRINIFKKKSPAFKGIITKKPDPKEDEAFDKILNE